MSNLKYLLITFLITCTSKKEELTIYSISSKAKCKGPSREYYTDLYATIDGYTRFHQRFFDGDDDYDAVSYKDSIGFTLTSDTLERWTETAEITVGIGHSFHMIAHDPKLVFDHDDHKFLDPMGNEVKIVFESNRVTNFQIINPFDQNENIEIFYSKWENVQGIDLPMNVQIIQGGKDEYFFEFYEVKVNDPLFKKIPIPGSPH